MIYLTVDDVDAAFERALATGFTVSKDAFYSPGPPTPMFWGERVCALLDPFGHSWFLGAKLEEAIDTADMKKNEEAWYAKFVGI